ncbi:hypothetical protein FH972_023232 [Carpinus fangiana]|uniref:Uncharacterized protein n=1 Tax=Carpinus fangiana TaxID=176857 RepID=A0A5N6KUL2_9ROSI|nr:hypothetical protein FH972_023232 [Carpinus fangiana]
MAEAEASTPPAPRTGKTMSEALLNEKESGWSFKGRVEGCEAMKGRSMRALYVSQFDMWLGVSTRCEASKPIKSVQNDFTRCRCVRVRERAREVATRGDGWTLSGGGDLLGGECAWAKEAKEDDREVRGQRGARCFRREEESQVDMQIREGARQGRGEIVAASAEEPRPSPHRAVHVWHQPGHSSFPGRGFKICDFRCLRVAAKSSHARIAFASFIAKSVPAVC